MEQGFFSLGTFPSLKQDRMKSYFKRYLENRCSDEQFESVIDAFSNTSKIGELNAQLEESWRGLAQDVETPDLSDTLFEIHYRINQEENAKRKSPRLLSFLTRVAAILLVPLAITFYYLGQNSTSPQELMQTVSTPMAAKTSFILPDGSKVWLNSGSTISYDVGFKGYERKVSLTGEAYFDVQKSKRPFVVETSYFSLKVLGTAFNVMAYEHEAPMVTLERGQVVLQTQSKERVLLNPSQQALIDTSTQKIKLNKVETNLHSSWIHNRLIFRDESLQQAIPRLERWYNVEIQLADRSLNSIPITAQIELESVQEVMDLMSLTMPISYQYNKDKRQLIIQRK